MRRPAAAVAALLVALVAVVAPATPASAHTKLAKAVPAAKATVTEPVAAVTLTFSGLVKQAGTTVAVLGADGDDYRTGDAKALDKTVTAPVSPLPLGKITVRWQTVSADGHTIKGEYAFTNKAPAPPVASQVPPTASPSLPAPTGEATVSAVAVVPTSAERGLSTGAIAAVVAAIAVIVAGLAGLLWWRRRRAVE